MWSFSIPKWGERVHSQFFHYYFSFFFVSSFCFFLFFSFSVCILSHLHLNANWRLACEFDSQNVSLFGQTEWTQQPADNSGEKQNAWHLAKTTATCQLSFGSAVSVAMNHFFFVVFFFASFCFCFWAHFHFIFASILILNCLCHCTSSRCEVDAFDHFEHKTKMKKEKNAIANCISIRLSNVSCRHVSLPRNDSSSPFEASKQKKETPANVRLLTRLRLAAATCCGTFAFQIDRMPAKKTEEHKQKQTEKKCFAFILFSYYVVEPSERMKNSFAFSPFETHTFGSLAPNHNAHIRFISLPFFFFMPSNASKFMFR